MKNRTKKTGCFLILLLCFFTCALSTAQADPLPEPARLLPPGTALLVDIRDFSQLKAQFEKTNFYRLYKDPAMAAFVEDCKSKLRERMRKLNNSVAEAVFNGDVLPQGRVVVALLLNEQGRNSGRYSYLSIIQWGKAVSRVREATEKDVKKAVEEGLHKRSEDYRGITIITLIKELPPKKVPDPSTFQRGDSAAPTMKTVQPPPEKTHYCFVEDSLIVSNDVDFLKFVIAHIKGAASATLADDTDYTATTRAVGPDHDIDFYVNIKQVLRVLCTRDSTSKAKTAVGNLGIDNVVSCGGSVGVSRQPGTSCGGKALLKINGAKRGICKMLEPESAVLRVPRFVPESASGAAFFNLDIKKAYDELGSILTRFSPQYAAWMYFPLPTSNSPDEAGLMIKDDIVGHLGSQIVVAQTIKKPFSPDSNPVESLVALAVNNRPALEKSLSLLHSRLIAPNNPNARRELLGRTIYLVKLPGFPFLGPGVTPMQGPGGPVASPMPALAFTFSDTHLIFGAEAAVERAVRVLATAKVASMASAKWFTSVKSAIPSMVGMASLQDNVASGELSWRMMKETGKSTGTGGGSSAGMGVGVNSNLNLVFSQRGLALFNFGLLPEFDQVRKYFGLSASYGVSRPDGFFFGFKYLNPSGSD
ncbi:MAG: hypothetical protein ACYS76_01365 [Planctomycetota bacterium]|jgi:hypothetical protein